MILSKKNNKKFIIFKKNVTKLHKGNKQKQNGANDDLNFQDALRYKAIERLSNFYLPLNMH